jgi:hypothetical protein
MTSTKWLGTAAVALVIGTGAVIAQTSPDSSQKREDSPRAQAPAKQAPMKDAESPAAGEQRQKGRTAEQPDSKAAPKDMKDTQRSEDKAAPQRQQAQEPSQARDSKQPTKQTQDQPGQRSPADAAQQRPGEQKGREAKQPADQKQQQSRDQQQKQDKAAGSKQPADAKQQTTQQPASQQPSSRDQASQPADAQKGDTAQQPARDAASQQQPGSATTTSATINDQQRTEVRERLSRERTAMSRETQNLNIQVNIGTQLPPRVRPRPLPPDIVRIVPRYRGYEYTVIGDEIVVLEPRTRRVVEIISEPGRESRMSAAPAGQRIVIAPEQRETLRQVVRRSSTTGSTGQSGAAFDANCLTLQAVPEELTSANPELGNYKMLAIGEQIVLIDPREQKVVEVID